MSFVQLGPEHLRQGLVVAVLSGPVVLDARGRRIEQTEERHVPVDDVDLVLIAKILPGPGRLVDEALFFGAPGGLVQVIG